MQHHVTFDVVADRIFFYILHSLLSGLGRRSPGRHHEQQRAVSRVLVAHLLNITQKCQKN